MKKTEIEKRIKTNMRRYVCDAVNRGNINEVLFHLDYDARVNLALLLDPDSVRLEEGKSPEILREPVEWKGGELLIVGGKDSILDREPANSREAALKLVAEGWITVIQRVQACDDARKHGDADAAALHAVAAMLGLFAHEDGFDRVTTVDQTTGASKAAADQRTKGAARVAKEARELRENLSGNRSPSEAAHIVEPQLVELAKKRGKLEGEKIPDVKRLADQFRKQDRQN